MHYEFVISAKFLRLLQKITLHQPASLISSHQTDGIAVVRGIGPQAACTKIDVPNQGVIVILVFLVFIIAVVNAVIDAFMQLGG